jgi:formylglycine-generating enzyme required for sulfatase activity
MNSTFLSRRALVFGMLLALCVSLSGPVSLIPSVEAASASASARIIKKLKKQIKTLKAQLAAARAVTPTPAAFIEMVKVGDVGNADDSTTFGAVPYEYSIGKYEVTLAQYTAFLNAVAATDAHALYNANMATDLDIAGIQRSGAPGSFTYSVIGTGTRPVTYVSWFDAARFCNWLHNGRPSGAQTAATTENGTYPLNGATTGGLTISRNPGAKYWIPSENEWYKAAYHQPTGQGGDVDNYWLYPTGSNAAPTAEVPPGGAGSANFNSVVNALTPVGAYTATDGFYGTFDQGGNVREWNDSVSFNMFRGVRGGSWAFNVNDLRSSSGGTDFPISEFNFIGFRVAGP